MWPRSDAQRGGTCARPRPHTRSSSQRRRIGIWLAWLVLSWLLEHHIFVFLLWPPVTDSGRAPVSDGVHRLGFALGLGVAVALNFVCSTWSRIFRPDWRVANPCDRAILCGFALALGSGVFARRLLA